MLLLSISRRSKCNSSARVECAPSIQDMLRLLPNIHVLHLLLYRFSHHFHIQVLQQLTQPYNLLDLLHSLLRADHGLPHAVGFDLLEIILAGKEVEILVPDPIQVFANRSAHGSLELCHPLAGHPLGQLRRRAVLRVEGRQYSK